MAEFFKQCPHCGVSLQMQSEWIGMNIECPQCKATFVVQNDNNPPPSPFAPNAQQQNPPPQFNQPPPQFNQPPPQFNQPPPQFNQPPPQFNQQPPQFNQQPQMGMGMNQQPPQFNQPPQMGMGMGMNQDFAMSTNWYVSVQEAEMIKKLFMWVWLGLILSIFTCGLGAIASTVCMLMMIYKLWRFIPAYEKDNISPGKAVGFLFIPFFAFYWMFVVYGTLGKCYQRYTNAPVASYGKAIAILTIVGLIPYVGIVASIAVFVLFILLFKELSDIASNLAAQNAGNMNGTNSLY